MIRYIVSHWQGDMPLGRALWANGIGIGLILLCGLAVARAAGDETFGYSGGLYTVLAMDILVLAVGTWQVTGVWRSATREARDTARRAMPGLAKTLALAAMTAGLAVLLPDGVHQARILAARSDPAIADFRIVNGKNGDLVFRGALNDRAAAALEKALQDPAIRVLRIESHGGLIVPTMALAETVAARKLAVMAERECLSACPLLLAASPRAIVEEGTRIAFHRPVPAHGVVERDGGAGRALLSARYFERYRLYGIAPDAVAEMAQRDIWAPPLSALVEMGLIDLMLAGNPARLVPADRFCTDLPQACTIP